MSAGELGDRVELEGPVEEWVRESVTLLRYALEELYPTTGGLGRGARREILLIHVRKGEALLRGDAPDTNAADALRDAVQWLEQLQEDEPEKFRELVGANPPRWFNWALRILPAAGLSRYARLARKDPEHV